MKTTVACVLLLAISVSGRNLLSSDAICAEPENCGPKSPNFTVIGHKGATEIREYSKATWAISFGRSVFGVDIAAAFATKGLLTYFAGENNQHMRIPPSLPLITTIAGPPHHHHHHPHPHPHHHKNSSHPELPEEDEADRTHPPHPPKTDSRPHPPHHHPHPPPTPPGPIVLVGAFVPVKGDVPVPDDRHVKLVRTNTSKVYVHEFGGFAISWLVKREIDHLKIDLKELGVKTCKGKFFVATYDGPLKIFGRKNEVWWTELPHHHHHHHNKTEEPKEISEPFGFEAWDPEVLFPEEMPPPPTPEEGPEDKDNVSSDLDVLDDLVSSESGISTDETWQTEIEQTEEIMQVS